jgi:protein-tyrosine phosphatase
LLKVLIVCTGNICRSPIAHGLLHDRARRVGEDWLEVRSAGTWGRSGSGATPEAVSAAAGLGVDIEAHRSSRFNDDMAKWADLIITMTTEQAAEVLQESPEARAKTFTLKELVSLLGSLPPRAAETRPKEGLTKRIGEADHARSSGHSLPADLDVADPLGLSETVYLAVANELEGLVDDLLRELIGGRESAAADG